VEARADRNPESNLEGFVGRDYLVGQKDWIPAFARMTEQPSILTYRRGIRLNDCEKTVQSEKNLNVS
jgi:hypothetical protein